MLISRPFWFCRQPQRTRSRRACGRRSCGLEGLESRQLLTAAALVTTVRGDLSAADSELNTVSDGTLNASDQQDEYTFTVSDTLGTGRLTAIVDATSGGIILRLALRAAIC